MRRGEDHLIFGLRLNLNGNKLSVVICYFLLSWLENTSIVMCDVALFINVCVVCGGRVCVFHITRVLSVVVRTRRSHPSYVRVRMYLSS